MLAGISKVTQPRFLLKLLQGTITKIFTLLPTQLVFLDFRGIILWSLLNLRWPLYTSWRSSRGLIAFILCHQIFSGN